MDLRFFFFLNDLVNNNYLIHTCVKSGNRTKIQNDIMCYVVGSRIYYIYRNFGFFSPINHLIINFFFSISKILWFFFFNNLFT